MQGTASERTGGWRLFLTDFIPCLDEISGVKNDYSLDAETYAKALKILFDRYFDSWRKGVAVIGYVDASRCSA